jgi:outer membrane protein TolC
LGLPDEAPLNLPSDVQPAFETIKLNETLAVRLAYENRLDLTSALEQVEDAKRGVQIAKNSLLPDLSLVAGTGTRASSGAAIREQVFNSHDASAGLTLNIPLDRTNEQIAAKQAQLGYERAERGYDLFRQELSTSVRNTLRNVVRLEKNIAIQKKLVEASAKSVEVAEIRFKQGTRTSREVADAQIDYQNAKNALISQTVDYAISLLDLQRSLGLLRVDAEGKPVGLLNRVLQAEANRPPLIEAPVGQDPGEAELKE